MFGISQVLVKTNHSHVSCLNVKPQSEFVDLVDNRLGVPQTVYHPKVICLVCLGFYFKYVIFFKCETFKFLCCLLGQDSLGIGTNVCTKPFLHAVIYLSLHELILHRTVTCLVCSI